MDVSLGWAEQCLGALPQGGSEWVLAELPPGCAPHGASTFPWINAEGRNVCPFLEAVRVNCEQATGAAEELSPSAALC